MQMSNIILLQKENIGLDAFSHLARIIHLHVMIKRGNINNFILIPYGVPNMSFLVNFNINPLMFQNAQNKLTMLSLFRYL